MRRLAYKVHSDFPCFVSQPGGEAMLDSNCDSLNSGRCRAVQCAQSSHEMRTSVCIVHT